MQFSIYFFAFDCPHGIDAFHLLSINEMFSVVFCLLRVFFP